LRLLPQPVVGGVVDAAHRKGRPKVVALGGVVVDHVEDHLDVGFVQRTNHGLELLDLSAGGGAAAVFRFGREETDRVVAPVVGKTLVDERRVVDEVMHRHQFDRVDAQRLHMLDDHRVRDRGVRAADLLGDLLVRLGEPLDVRLVDDRVGVFVPGRSIHTPVEVRVDHHRLGHAGRRVVVVAAVRIAEVVAEQRLVPLEGAVDRLRVRVDQQFVRVAALSRGRIVAAVYPVAVALAGLDVGDEAVPDEAVDFGQRHPGLNAVDVEQAQLDLLSGLAEHREIGARAVVGGA
jgi:hypothetical protein